MESGYEDRADISTRYSHVGKLHAAVEPGDEDREESDLHATAGRASQGSAQQPWWSSIGPSNEASTPGASGAAMISPRQKRIRYAMLTHMTVACAVGPCNEPRIDGTSYCAMSARG